MGARVRLVFAAVGVACALGACSAAGAMGRGLRSMLRAERPLAVANFEENRIPIAPGSHGQMVGYIPVSDRDSDDPRDALFTYVVEFQVVHSRAMGEQLEFRGVRRVFFNPSGAHASFADPASFGRGREVRTDVVRFFGDYDREDTRLTLKMRVCESTPAQESSGQAVAAPADEPSIFIG